MKEVTELIGKTGTLIQSITVMGAVEAEDGTIDVLVKDDHGNEFWVEKDGNVSLF
ncbi:hypothetical protein [Paenibacillus graminis]|uniref:hypothetical protein n=1 Tax=Paenibacillus graminis TaxID=189425 RepID=UPI0004BB731D|nr:hypothetical protein [Paenibacillus graminis]